MFFFDESLRSFEPFGLAHGVPWLILMVLIAMIILYRNKVTAQLDLWIRRGVVVMMLGMEWTFYSWAINNGGFQTSLLPLGVCAISVYITSIALWTKNEKVFQIIFPWAVTGALLSLTVADMSYAFPHFRYIHYFGNHSLFMLGNIYLLLVHRFSFEYKHLLKSSLYLLIYTALIYPLNFLLDANHLFLRELPEEVASLFSFLGAFWIIGLIVAIFALFNAIYLPLLLRNKKLSSEKSLQSNF